MGRRIVAGAFIGGLYGFALTWMGVIVAGGGHGTLVLLAVPSAPFALLGPMFWLIPPTIMWSTIGALLPLSNKKLSASFVLTHYLSAGVLLTQSLFNDWEYFLKAWHALPGIITADIGLYLLGQLIFWVLLFKSRAGAARSKGSWITT